MTYRLSEEQEALRQMVRKVAREQIAPGANERDEKGHYPWDMVDIFKKSRFYALSIPEKYGGLGGKILDFCLVMEEVCRVCNNCGAILTFSVLGSYPILLGGSEKQKMEYLPSMASGQVLGAYALSEPDSGSDAASLNTQAVLEGNHYVINGSKCFISNFDAADVMILFARTNPEGKASRGISAFIVEKEREKIPSWLTRCRSMPKMGMKAMHTFELDIVGLRVPHANLIGKDGDGFTIAMETLDRGRLTVGAQGVGTAQGALDLAADWAKKRKQFGQAIGVFQGVQFMLADMAIQVEAARHLLYMAAAHADAGGLQVALYGAMAKCFATDVAMKVTTDAVQILGGYGYMRDLPAERLMRDAKAMQIYEGTNQVQRIIIARNLLGRL